LAGGTRYHVHFVPDEEAIADFYLTACERFSEAGIAQYEISNFAHEGFESLHNLKYWTRQPYLGFGVDAHSMLLSAAPDIAAVRFAPADSLEQYMSGTGLQRTPVSCRAALEESFFLGLRLTRGISVSELVARFGEETIEAASAAIAEFVEDGLMEQRADFVCLTARGRLLSNEVFERFIVTDEIVR
jgi:oxygen-independent coproporphyrinogen-3 oxidase